MWDDIAESLRHPLALGCGPIQVVATAPFWEERDLPFRLAEGGAVLRILPDAGFPKGLLAESEDERMLLVDHPAGGWLVPGELVGAWMAKHVSSAPLDDILLSHPLYEYLTRPDEDGLSRGGRMPLVQWMPGIPTLASIQPPEFLPDDDEAPDVNRDRDAYAEAVVDLLEALRHGFDLHEIEVGIRMESPITDRRGPRSPYAP